MHKCTICKKNLCFIFFKSCLRFFHKHLKAWRNVNKISCLRKTFQNNATDLYITLYIFKYYNLSQLSGPKIILITTIKLFYWVITSQSNNTNIRFVHVLKYIESDSQFPLDVYSWLIRQEIREETLSHSVQAIDNQQ